MPPWGLGKERSHAAQNVVSREGVDWLVILLLARHTQTKESEKKCCHDGGTSPQIPLLTLISLRTDTDEIPIMFSASVIVIIFLLRSSSFTWSTFLSASVPQLQGRSHYFWTWKPLKILRSLHFILFSSYFQQFKTFSSISPQCKAKFYTDMLLF